MTQFQGTPGFQHDQPGTTGILITNLGTPDAPTPAALRRYLAEFLWDPRVVEVPRPIWWLVLHGIILRIRPGKVAKTYASVWQDDGSPLLSISRAQRDAIQQALKQTGSGRIKVALGMRYGNPSIASALEELRNAGARRILVLPLYPQYSASTTASTFDAVTDTLRGWRWIPEVRFVNHYHDNTGYIEALANSVRDYQQEHGRPDRLLMSFHGVPKRYLLNGDPYFCECHKTARLLAETLGLDEEAWQLSFQSRFGREEWLKPYTDHTLEDWAKQGIKKVQVICPGFSADCLETLEEIAVENHNLFLTAGGETLNYIPALNTRPDHIQALARLIEQHIQGWPEASTQEAALLTEEARLCRERASGLGAEG